MTFMNFPSRTIAVASFEPSPAGNSLRDRSTLLTWIGVISGLSIAIRLSVGVFATLDGLLWRAVLAVSAMVLLMTGWSRSAGWIAGKLQLSVPQIRAYLRNDRWAAASALLTVLCIFGVRFDAPQIICLAIVMLGARALAIGCVLAPAQREEVFTSTGWLAFLFLVSGFSALIYQIVWQRAMFAAFGVNIESITLVVALFMFGLGIGSLAGGLVARRLPRHAPLLFLTCEFAIGAFGLVSLPLIHIVAHCTLRFSVAGVAGAIFALLCIPTLFMGATLPILVAHLYRHYRNLGQSVGILYSINTLGSAAACFLTADVLFVFGGLKSAIVVAACCNFAVGILAGRYAWKSSRSPHSPSVPTIRIENPSQPASRLLILALAAAGGFISISQEMLWMRLIGYITGGAPTVFAHVLGCFLIGVAGGALLAESWCGRTPAHRQHPIRLIGFMLISSAMFYYFSIAAVARLTTWQPELARAAIYAIVAITSLLLGGVFTVLCHHASRTDEPAGVTVSRVYLANIIGCTLAPLLCGFVLMQFVGTERIILLLSAATAIIGAAALFFTRRSAVWAPGLGAVCVVLMLVLHPFAYDDFLARLQFNDSYTPRPYSAVVENRCGIITVQSSPGGGDIIYGGGMYDGRFNIDPLVDSNLIFRCYMIAALHPHPDDVLEIGLSSASWTRVLADYPPIRHVLSVEINPGYVDLLRSHGGRFPRQASVLDDPKVSIAIDDGRRWLNRHPGRRFDLIVQNTTWHWRSEITNLLSVEYLTLCKQHLKPGGVFYYNATQSEDVPYTAAHVFRHVTRVGSFFAASDAPFTMTPEQIAGNLLRFRDAGQNMFDSPDPRRQRELRTKLTALAQLDLKDMAMELRRRRDLWMITDDNMTTEFKRVRDDTSSGADRTRWWDGDRTWKVIILELSREFR